MKIEIYGKPGEGTTSMAYAIARLLKKRNRKKVKQLIFESDATKKLRALGIDYDFPAYVPITVKIIYDINEVGENDVLICDEPFSLTCEGRTGLDDGCKCFKGDVIHVIRKLGDSEMNRYEEKVDRTLNGLKEKLDKIDN